MFGLKNSRHFLNQSELKAKPIVTRSRKFSRALRQLHVFYSPLSKRVETWDENGLALSDGIVWGTRLKTNARAPKLSHN